MKAYEVREPTADYEGIVRTDRERPKPVDDEVNYVETPDWGEAVRERTGGVDHVVEVGGPGTLDRSLAAAGLNGHVHLIGVLAGPEGEVDPSPVLHKSLDVEGVMGAGSRAMFDRMNRAIDATGMEPVIDRTFGFDEVREAYRYVEAGEHQGKVVIGVE